MIFRVDITARAAKTLGDIGDRKVQKKLLEACYGLAQDPEKQGKLLREELSGIRSFRFSRFRILYRVLLDKKRVRILAMGRRKAGSKDDIYVLAKKLLSVGLVASKPRKKRIPSPTMGSICPVVRSMRRTLELCQAERIRRPDGSKETCVG